MARALFAVAVVAGLAFVAVALYLWYQDRQDQREKRHERRLKREQRDYDTLVEYARRDAHDDLDAGDSHHRRTEDPEAQDPRRE